MSLDTVVTAKLSHQESMISFLRKCPTDVVCQSTLSRCCAKTARAAESNHSHNRLILTRKVNQLLKMSAMLKPLMSLVSPSFYQHQFAGVVKSLHADLVRRIFV